MKDLKWFVVENNFLPRCGYMDFGWGNGYVVIPEGHNLYGMHFNDIHDKFEIEVNGGLTFSDYAKNIKNWEIKGLMENDWIIGFDTAHSWDTLTMWPKSAVEHEAKKLSEQISKL